jgi:hypothetical protein
MSVLRPMTVKADGFIFVLRGSTRDPVYVFSDTGELIRTVTLKAANLEFSSPMVFGNQLVVHQHRAAPTTDGVPVLTEPELNVFPVFDLNSGVLVQQFEWRQDGELACYDQSDLTIVQQGMDYPDHDYWAIIRAQPGAPTKPKPPRSASADIALQIRWVVRCDDGTHSVPLRGDEAAARYCLAENELADESDIDSANVDVDAFNQPALRLAFTPEGSEKLRRATSARNENEGELGIVIDDELVLKVRVVGPLGHEAVVTGPRLNREELNDWVTRLNAKARGRALRKSI